MTDWRTLSDFHKKRIDKNIQEVVEPGHFTNKHSGFEWDDPDYTIAQVHAGNYCADCLMIYYNCLCGHGS